MSSFPVNEELSEAFDRLLELLQEKRTKGSERVALSRSTVATAISDCPTSEREKGGALWQAVCVELQRRGWKVEYEEDIIRFS